MNATKSSDTTEAMPRPIVGAVYKTHPGTWWVPAGLESTQGPDAKPAPYVNISFGAPREWKNDEDGFEPYYTPRKRRQLQRKSRRMQYEDQYGFDDNLY